MPLPFILWAAAAGLAATGVVKGADALDIFNEAKEIGNNSEKRYKKSQNDLELCKEKTNRSLQELGELKLSIFKNQINHLVQTMKKYKDAKSKLVGFNTTISIEELAQMERLVLKSLEISQGLGKGLGAGVTAAFGAYGSVGAFAAASTGTAISTLSGAAATNATLAWLGGGALSAGGFGVAGGTLALGGIVLGPALAIGGFMLASKAEQALTQAKKYEADIDIAIAKFKESQVILKGIQANTQELGNALIQMAKRFDYIKVDNDRNPPALDKMIIIGKGLKNLLDIPTIQENGKATENIRVKISGHFSI
jgi:hypothetical protein